MAPLQSLTLLVGVLSASAFAPLGWTARRAPARAAASCPDNPTDRFSNGRSDFYTMPGGHPSSTGSTAGVTSAPAVEELAAVEKSDATFFTDRFSGGRSDFFTLSEEHLSSMTGSAARVDSAPAAVKTSRAAMATKPDNPTDRFAGRRSDFYTRKGFTP